MPGHGVHAQAVGWWYIKGSLISSSATGQCSRVLCVLISCGSLVQLLQGSPTPCGRGRCWPAAGLTGPQKGNMAAGEHISQDACPHWKRRSRGTPGCLAASPAAACLHAQSGKEASGVLLQPTSQVVVAPSNELLLPRIALHAKCCNTVRCCCSCPTLDLSQHLYERKTACAFPLRRC